MNIGLKAATLSEIMAVEFHSLYSRQVCTQELEFDAVSTESKLFTTFNTDLLSGVRFKSLFQVLVVEILSRPD